MIIKKILLIVSLFLLTVAIFIGYTILKSNLQGTKSDTKRNTQVLNNNPNKETNKDSNLSSENQDTAPVSSPVQANFVYDIKGSLSNLTNKQKEKMDIGRGSIVNNVRNKMYKDIYINGPIDKGNTVALTFDDGPDAKNTEKIINILRDNTIQATFFMIGNNVENFPNIVKEANQNGNLILGHSYTHPQFTNLKPSDLVNELTLTDNIIYRTIGKKPAITRPPYGEVNSNVMKTLNENNVTTVIWSIDTLDWANPKNKENVIKNVVDNIRPGDIVLMHSTKDVTVDALPEIIEKLKVKGYRFLRIDEMLGVEAYK